MKDFLFVIFIALRTVVLMFLASAFGVRFRDFLINAHAGPLLVAIAYAALIFVVLLAFMAPAFLKKEGADWTP